MCLQCKEEHVINLDTLHHNVTIYRQKYNHPLKKETCLNHQKCYYSKYCETCEVPVCDSCSEHTAQRSPLFACLLGTEQIHHKVLSIKSAYKKKVRKHQQMICDIRSNTIYNRTVVLAGLYSDINNSETYHRRIDLCQSKMFEKGQKLKDSINAVQEMQVDKETYQEIYSMQMLKLTRHIARIQKFVDEYHQNVSRPIKFLQFIERSSNLQKQDSLHLAQHKFLFPNIEINARCLIDFLSCVKITNRLTRHAKIERLLRRMSSVECKIFKISDFTCCFHVSLVSTYRIWVSGYDNHAKIKLILKSTSDETLHIVKDVLNIGKGCHTVNRENDLIYIDNKLNIKKLSSDNIIKRTLIELKDPEWKPQCVHCSTITGDLLIGMHSPNTKESKVERFDKDGLLTQTIEKQITGHTIYKEPCFLTENNNEDVVVSDYFGSDRGAVVVTDRSGNHRFSYEGLHTLYPKGICTDPLSNILVCSNEEVQIIDRDGQFLSHLIQHSEWVGFPQSLSYDIKTHLLYVGYGAMFYNRIRIFSYISRYDALTGKCLESF